MAAKIAPEALLGGSWAGLGGSWAALGASLDRLGRQHARMQVLLQFCCKMQVLRRLQLGAQPQSYYAAQAPPQNLLYRYDRYKRKM